MELSKYKLPINHLRPNNPIEQVLTLIKKNSFQEIILDEWIYTVHIIISYLLFKENVFYLLILGIDICNLQFSNLGDKFT